MPTLTTGGASTFDIPTTQLGRIAERVQDQSVLATLSPERPSLYGNVQAVRMSRKPRAQIVAEGAQKTSDLAAWDSVTAAPIKFQTTVRMTDEVKWMDEDHRLLIVQDLVEALGDSAARAVDLIGIHGINPITGLRAASVTSFLNQTTNRTVAGAAPTDELIAAVGAIAGGRYQATGAALDNGYAFGLATEQYADGRDRNPGLGFGTNVQNWKGLQVATSSAVSGQPEAADTDLRALVGDYTQVKWGFQRRFPVEVIEYGDPDGGGDLKGNNQIAYRVEGVIYVAIFDLDAFAAIDAPAAP
jgi:HK97 family phage major capsid protein